MIWFSHTIIVILIVVTVAEKCSVPYITQYIPIEGKQLENDVNFFHNVSDIDSCRSLCNPRINMVPFLNGSFFLTHHVDLLKNFASFMYNKEKRVCIVETDPSTSNSSHSEHFDPQGFIFYERRCFNISASKFKLVQKLGKYYKITPSSVQFKDGSKHSLTRVQIGEVFDIEMQVSESLVGNKPNWPKGFSMESSLPITVRLHTCHYNLSEHAPGTNTLKTVKLVEEECPTSNLNQRLTKMDEYPVVFSTSLPLFYANSSKLTVHCGLTISSAPSPYNCEPEYEPDHRKEKHILRDLWPNGILYLPAK